jgi:hypothetical protein
MDGVVMGPRNQDMRKHGRNNPGGFQSVLVLTAPRGFAEVLALLVCPVDDFFHALLVYQCRNVL